MKQEILHLFDAWISSSRARLLCGQEDKGAGQTQIRGLSIYLYRYQRGEVLESNFCTDCVEAIPPLTLLRAINL